MIRFLKPILALIAILSLALSACTPAAAPSPTAKPAAGASTAAPAAAAPTTAPAAAAAPAGVIKIGLSASITGAGAPWGLAAVQTGEVVRDKINAAGGITVGGKKYTIQLLPYDHAFDAAKAVENVRRMIDSDKVQFIYTQGEAATLPALEITNKQKMITMDSTGGTKTVSNFPYNYRITPSTPEVRFIDIEYFAAKGLKKIAMLNPDDASGHDDTDGAKKGMTKYGGELISEEYYPRGTKDFAPYIKRMMDKKPDVIDVGVSPPDDQPLQVKQIYEAGWRNPIRSLSYPYPEIVNIAGKGADLVEGYGAWIWPEDPNFMTTEEKALVQTMKDRFKEWRSLNFIYYSWLDILTQAIVKADSFDSDKIKGVLESTTFTKLGRPYKFAGTSFYGRPGQSYQEAPIAGIKDGKQVVSKMVNFVTP